ncbi:MAG TPA: type II toxin-antitoxin system prevent-host-death family antitoxin [Allosphingosinicella sp.]|nr:type II toxin-antitoxin system prevent-host-death family antitoxin [Allosphingosinicella sp.]
MDKAISASEANQRFSEMLRQVANGESFTVTSRGRPVARVIPIEVEDQQGKIKRLLDYVETLPIRRAGPWKREDLYD